jgi:hypothetical protein
MNDKNYTGLIPENKKGKEITAEHSTTFGSDKDAKSFYNIARERLLNVNNWGKVTDNLAAIFQLTDEKGNEVNREAKKGDHFRIDIIGPGSKAGDGYDWAIVEEINEVNEKNIESIAIIVRPAANPRTSDGSIAHFYSESSTSTFIITREGKKVTASIFDRNIEANEKTNKSLDKLRNVAIGFSAKNGFSKAQWQALAEGLVNKDQ